MYLNGTANKPSRFAGLGLTIARAIDRLGIRYSTFAGSKLTAIDRSRIIGASSALASFKDREPLGSKRRGNHPPEQDLVLDEGSADRSGGSFGVIGERGSYWHGTFELI